jgi:glutaredoxin 2
MTLYMFEHCSLCFRVRMIAALKGIPLEEVVVEDDDSQVMIGLVGRRVIPILVRDDGQPMLESMDMVKYIDAQGDSVLTGRERPEITTIAEAILDTSPVLTMPRYPLLGLPEFRSVAAHDHYIVRKRKVYGDFAELRAKTREFVAELAPTLEALDKLIEAPKAINGTLSLDDIRVVPLLRSLAVVEGLVFPPKVQEYFNTMMERVRFSLLPVI